MLPAAKHELIKAAQEELIAAAGGQMRAAAICNYGKSTVGRWADRDSPEWMPLDAVDRLETATGRNVFTGAWLESRGLRLADPDAEAVSQAGVMSRHAEAIIRAGELMSAGAAAFADGRCTPNEAAAVDRAAAQLERTIAELRKSLAGIRAAGGLSVVGGAQ